MSMGAKEPGSEIIKKPDGQILADVVRSLASGPNALHQLFTRPVVIGLADLETLYTDIHEKLKHHPVALNDFHAYVRFSGNRTREFSSWSDFQKYNWCSPEKTETLILRWTIAVRDEVANEPVAHTMTVRIASPVHPIYYLQAVLSKNPQEIDELEMKDAPVSCRIDFAHTVFGDELMDRVKRWNEGRGVAVPTSWWYPVIRNNQTLIGWFVKYSMPIIAMVSAIVYFLLFNRGANAGLPVTVGYMYHAGLWFAFSMTAIYVTALVSRLISDHVQTQIQMMGRYSVFNLTDGDKSRQNEIAGRQIGSLRSFIFSSLFSFIYDAALVFASLILSHLFPAK